MEVLPPSDGGVVAPVVSHYQGGNIRHHEGDLCQPRGDIKPANNLVAVTVFLLKNMSSDVCREGHLPITETLVVSHNTPQTPLCEVLCATLKLGGGGETSNMCIGRSTTTPTSHQQLFKYDCVSMVGGGACGCH